MSTQEPNLWVNPTKVILLRKVLMPTFLVLCLVPMRRLLLRTLQRIWISRQPICYRKASFLQRTRNVWHAARGIIAVLRLPMCWSMPSNTLACHTCGVAKTFIVMAASTALVL